MEPSYKKGSKLRCLSLGKISLYKPTENTRSHTYGELELLRQILLVALKEAVDRKDSAENINKWMIDESEHAFSSNFVLSAIINDDGAAGNVKKYLVELFSTNKKLLNVRKRYKLENLLFQIRENWR